MNRSDWLMQTWHEVEWGYDTIWAPLYGEKWGMYGNASHLQFIQKFMGQLSQHSTILDAACGAGRYMSVLLAAGHSIIGIDQSQGMLARAPGKIPRCANRKARITGNVLSRNVRWHHLHGCSGAYLS